MNINGIEKVVHGKVLMCTGDTLGQHYCGGYKEGVGAAFQKCRNCQCTFEQMQTDFLEEAMTLNRHQLNVFRKIYKQRMDLHEEVFFASFLCLM